MKIKHHPPRRALALLLALVLCLSAMPVAFAGQEDGYYDVLEAANTHTATVKERKQ